MKHFVATMITLVLWLGVCTTTSAHGDKPAQAAGVFTGLETDAAKAAQAFSDALAAGQADVAARFLAGDVLIFEGGVERSAAEYAAHHMKSDMQFLKHMQQEVLEHQVRIYGDAALSTKRMRTTGTFKGKAIDTIGYETLHLVKTNAGWKINHIHWSR